MLSEISQTEKDKYHMISVICGINKQTKKQGLQRVGLNLVTTQSTASIISLQPYSILDYIYQFSLSCSSVLKGTFYNFISTFTLKKYLFLAVLGLCCCVQAFSSGGEQGRPGCGGGPGSLGGLSSWSSRARAVAGSARRLSSCDAQAQLLHGIWKLLNQGLNPCRLPWQTNSLPLDHQGSPTFFFFS